jgi:2-dehydro-3-deoxyglucarate aldolase
VKKQKSIGTWICSYNSINLEILKNSKFDWFTVDLEHSAMTLDMCFNIISYIKSSSTKLCFVRMSDLNQSNIKRVLDFGADGIIIPMVKDKNDIENIIDAAHYPPLGSRGTGLFRAQGYGDKLEDYIKESYKNTKIIIQIEHIDAIENFHTFLKYDAINGFIIGPYDLSASLGKPGDFENKKFKNAIEKFESLCSKTEKDMGYHMAFPDSKKLKRLLKTGYNFIGYSTDILLFKTQINVVNKDISNCV